VRFLKSNAIALLALVFAMTGTGIAASHYVITSTKQIKPSVLRKLHGARGSRGATGATGRTGAQGPLGPVGRQGPPGIVTQGPENTFPSTLPAGRTLTGAWEVDANNPTKTGTTPASVAISFQFPLAAAPAAAYVFAGEHTKECPGSVTEPRAASGFVCFYEGEVSGAHGVGLLPPSRFGAEIETESEEEEGFFFLNGTWAVTG